MLSRNMVINLAIYSKNNLKKHNRVVRKNIGIILVSVFSVLFINMLFNIIPFINSFFLGAFGLFSYPMFVGLMIYGIMLIADRRMSVNFSTLIFYLVLIVLLASLIQVITSKKYLDLSYSEYCLLEIYLSINNVNTTRIATANTIMAPM